MRLNTTANAVHFYCKSQRPRSVIHPTQQGRQPEPDGALCIAKFANP
jgi:hypothetical protein